MNEASALESLDVLSMIVASVWCLIQTFERIATLYRDMLNLLNLTNPSNEHPPSGKTFALRPPCKKTFPFLRLWGEKNNIFSKGQIGHLGTSCSPADQEIREPKKDQNKCDLAYYRPSGCLSAVPHRHWALSFSGRWHIRHGPLWRQRRR